MAALTDFTFAFEVATTSSPRTASPTYTALTSFVMAGQDISLSRGRDSEQDAVATAGRATVVLRNTDGRFTWANGSSPYAPLKLRRPCRFRVTYSGTTYDRWQGFVDEWGNARDELTGIARLAMSDRLARAAFAKLPDQLRAEILSDGPAILWPLQENETATSSRDVVGTGLVLKVRQLGSAGSGWATWGIVGPIPSESTSVALTPSSAANYKSLFVRTDGGTYAQPTAAVTYEMYFQLNEALAGGPLTLFDAGDQSVKVDTGGALFVSNLLGAGPKSSPVLGDGQFHHMALVVTWDSGTNQQDAVLYLDGVNIGGVSGLSGGLDVSNFIEIGAGVSCRAAYVAVHNAALSGARIAVRMNPAEPEGITTRFNRACAAAGLPSAFYATSGTTERSAAPQVFEDRDLLTVAGELATLEQGVLFVNRSGVLTLATAAARYNTSVGLTLDCRSQVLADSLDFRTDTDSLINDSTARLVDGSDVQTTDATSINDYDLHDETESLITSDPVVALNWTQWRVGANKDPRPRCSSVTVDVVAFANAGGSVAQLLAADVGTKVRLTNLPSDIYATSTLDLFVDGVRDGIGKHTYRITFTTAPVTVEDSLWVLGTSALGTGTRLGY